MWVDDVMMKNREARPGGGGICFLGGLGNTGAGDRIPWSPACDVWELIGG